MVETGLANKGDRPVSAVRLFLRRYSECYKFNDFFDSWAFAFAWNIFPEILYFGIIAFQGKSDGVCDLISDFAFRDAFLLLLYVNVQQSFPFSSAP